MSEPLVGIALAAYKPDVEYFCAQLQSIADQTYTNWFCIVGFDSAIDGIRGEPTLARFFADERFTFVLNHSQLGVVGNFEATGVACLTRNPKYIAYSDQDDIWYPNKIAKLVESLNACLPMSVVHSDMHIHMLQSDGSFKNLDQTAWQLERRGVHHVSPIDFFIRNVVAGAGMLMDAELVRRYPNIPAESYGQDHWYPLVASYFGAVQPLDEPLYEYRIHGANVAGVGPYQGLFSASRDSQRYGLVRKCMLAFNSSRSRVEKAVEARLPVTFMQKLVISAFFDLGAGYFIKALSVFGNDRALARACIARGLGKALRIFNPRTTEVSRLS